MAIEVVQIDLKARDTQSGWDKGISNIEEKASK